MYRVPLDVDGNPALIAKTEDINAKVAVDRIKNINGSLADRTLTFTVTAEDDTTKQNYSVELVKEKDRNKIQPYKADPFFSEIVFGDMWRNSYGEICNPGNQVLDLSNYMIAMAYINNPAAMIALTNQNKWNYQIYEIHSGIQMAKRG